MERETGLEPATSSLGSWHSTTELLPLRAFCSTCHFLQKLALPIAKSLKSLVSILYPYGVEKRIPDWDTMLS